MYEQNPAPCADGLHLCDGCRASDEYPPGYAATHTTLTTGSCGDNATYEYWRDGNGEITLEISGTGMLEKVPSYEVCPTHIIVNEGIISIGARAFQNMDFYRSPPTDIDIAGSVKTIEKCALQSCYVSIITLHEGLETIGDYGLNPDFSDDPDATDNPTILIPASVKSIGEEALRATGKNLHGAYTPNIWVYSGSVGEQWCIDNDIRSYRVISDNLSSYDKAYYTFSQAVDAVRDLYPSATVKRSFPL